jgi:hypothetical protein
MRVRVWLLLALAGCTSSHLVGTLPVRPCNCPDGESCVFDPACDARVVDCPQICPMPDLSLPNEGD